MYTYNLHSHPFHTDILNVFRKYIYIYIKLYIIWRAFGLFFVEGDRSVPIKIMACKVEVFHLVGNKVESNEVEHWMAT